ncbi:MAG: carbonic anhydrase [Pseudonocardiaceae bacterium]
MTAIEDLVDRNKVRSVTGPGVLASPPSLRLAVVACMDARIDPVQLLGLRPGEAHVIRNAGGETGDLAEVLPSHL